MERPLVAAQAGHDEPDGEDDRREIGAEVAANRLAQRQRAAIHANDADLHEHLAEGLTPAVVEPDEVGGADEPVEEMSGRSHRSPAPAAPDRPAHPPEDSLDDEKEESVDDVGDKAYPESRRAGRRFHAHLYFEVHELLEPYWMRAEGSARIALQGLIQVAVGFQHLANRNVSGALSLLHDGCGKVLERQLEGVPLDPFGRALQRCVARIDALGDEAPTAFDWNEVPRFPVRVSDE